MIKFHFWEKYKPFCYKTQLLKNSEMITAPL